MAPLGASSECCACLPFCQLMETVFSERFWGIWRLLSITKSTKLFATSRIYHVCPMWLRTFYKPVGMYIRACLSVCIHKRWVFDNWLFFFFVLIHKLKMSIVQICITNREFQMSKTNAYKYRQTDTAAVRNMSNCIILNTKLDELIFVYLKYIFSICVENTFSICV